MENIAVAVPDKKERKRKVPSTTTEEKVAKKKTAKSEEKEANKQEKAEDGYIIKRPLLAEKLDDLSNLKLPVLATPKIDGIRALRLGGALISRQFKPIRNKVIQEVLKTLLPEGSDGEVIIDGHFSEVSSAVMSSGGSEAFSQPFKYYWFDYVKDDPKKPYSERIKDMKQYVVEHPELLNHEQAIIIPLYPIEMQTVEQLLEYEEKVLGEGFEGVMLRSFTGPYKMGRSTVREGTLLKLKKFSDDEAEVIDVQEQFKNTNESVKNETGQAKRSQKKEGLVAAGKLGALVVKSKDGSIFNIGTGFKDEERVSLWNEREVLVGRLVKYKYQEIGSKNAPRFPTFIGFRDPDDM
jgi:DNA ligase 1